MAKPANKKPTLIKPMALKGFREWLPEEKILEQRILDTIRSEYEAYGFVPIETAAVERNEILLSKGGLSTKEIYQLTRLAAEPGEKNKDRDYSLHFDLTVPFARYTAQNFGKLVFPFKRYQIQKVWRGERPGKGRFREFYQADIDIIGSENLSISYDAEVLAVIDSIFTKLDIGDFVIRVNNRKLHHGLIQKYSLPSTARMASFQACIATIRGMDVQATSPEAIEQQAIELLTRDFGLDAEGREARKVMSWVRDRGLSDADIEELFQQFEEERVIRELDAIDKVSADELLAQLTGKLAIAPDTAQSLLEFAQLASASDDQGDLLQKLKGLCDGDIYQQGITELETLLAESDHLGVPQGRVVIDPKIARGLNYYTGVIYETNLLADPDLGSVCSGGRYDNLASQFTRKKLPGVGISIGVTRLVSSIIEKQLLPVGKPTVAAVMLAIAEPAVKHDILQLARRLRAAGIACEVCFVNNLSKQMKYAAKKGFGQVIVATADELQAGQVRVRDMSKTSRDEAETVVSLAELEASLLP